MPMTEKLCFSYCRCRSARTANCFCECLSQVAQNNTINALPLKSESLTSLPVVSFSTNAGAGLATWISGAGGSALQHVRQPAAKTSAAILRVRFMLVFVTYHWRSEERRVGKECR